jgi:hypothetical protein
LIITDRFPSLLHTIFKKTGDTQIIDLCSGGGGPIEMISNSFEKLGADVPIILSDKFPNIKAYNYLKEKTDGKIDYITEPVDAANVPKELSGFRTMFSAIHHFPPEMVKQVVRNALDNRSGIGIFDGGDKNIFTILGILIVHPIAFLLFTPFFRPFKLSRLLFTYILPLIPLYTIWDGCISIIRLYRPAELLQLAKDADEDNVYEWQSGKIKNKFGMNVCYLIGYPKP